MDWRRLGPATDVRPLFRTDRAALLDLLGELTATDWRRPTVCPGWNVRDVVAHVLHDHLRRLSAGRDGHRTGWIDDVENLPALLARDNGRFVETARVLSPRVLTELLADAGPRLDAYWAALDPSEIGEVDVWWAAPGEPAPRWLDIAREYTEYWAHHRQIRDAVGAPAPDDPAGDRAMADTILRSLPRTLRTAHRPRGTAVRVRVPGPAGGEWTATRDADGWTLAAPPTARPAAEITIGIGPLWRLATRGIGPDAAEHAAEIRGDETLARTVLTFQAIIG